MKMRIITAMLLLFLMSCVAAADSVDVSASLNKVYSLSLNVVPEVAGDIAVISELALQFHKAKIDSQGDMTKLGDYEVYEGGRHHFVLGLGYRVREHITPWVAVSLYSTKTTKHEMKTSNSQLNKVTTDITEPVNGVALGLSFEYWVDRLGVSALVGKVPEGVLLNARVKYNVSGIGTAHIGYTYSSYLGHGVTVGLGVVY
jgi:opacity protein-like surface antigen